MCEGIKVAGVEVHTPTHSLQRAAKIASARHVQVCMMGCSHTSARRHPHKLRTLASTQEVRAC